MRVATSIFGQFLLKIFLVTNLPVGFPLQVLPRLVVVKVLMCDSLTLLLSMASPIMRIQVATLTFQPSSV